MLASVRTSARRPAVIRATTLGPNAAASFTFRSLTRSRGDALPAVSAAESRIFWILPSSQTSDRVRSDERRPSAGRSTPPTIARPYARLSADQTRLPCLSVALKSSRTWASNVKLPLFSVDRVTRWWPWRRPGSVT